MVEIVQRCLSPERSDFGNGCFKFQLQLTIQAWYNRQPLSIMYKMYCAVRSCAASHNSFHVKFLPVCTCTGTVLVVQYYTFVAKDTSQRFLLLLSTGLVQQLSTSKHVFVDIARAKRSSRPAGNET